jgi:hypothetical protein
LASADRAIVLTFTPAIPSPRFLTCTAQGRRHHQVRKLRHQVGKKKHQDGRQEDSERYRDEVARLARIGTRTQRGHGGQDKSTLVRKATPM